MENDNTAVDAVEVDETKDQTTEEAKSFTQAELDAKFAERASRAKADLLKELGIDDLDKTKTELAKFKEHQQAQKTEAQKQAEELQAKETRLAELQAENDKLATKFAISAKGVKADSLDDVALLAKALVTDDKTIEVAIDEVLVKYPHFVAEVDSDVPSIVKDGNMTINTKNNDPFKAKLEKWKNK